MFDYELESQGLVLVRGKIFHFSVASSSGAHPASYPVGTGGCFSPGKVAGAEAEADFSSPSSAEAKNDGAMPVLSHIYSGGGA
jgi:hypothetical protein